MSKFRVSIVAIFAVLLAALAIAVPALADPVTPNSASTQIPVKLDINVGSSYDLTGITYEIDIAGKTYSAALPTNVREYPSTSTISNAPLTINLGTTAPTSSTDTLMSWSANWTLAQLFGADPTVNFPDAGMYEFDIGATHTGDEATDWNYTLPSYKLQVLIKNKSDMTGREYGGWVLTNDDGDKINNDDENDPSNPALFSATNKATGTLNVTKQVSGDYASTTHAFEQTITLMLPEWAKTATIIATDPDGETLTAVSTNEGATRTYTARLAHNQTAVFANVPVGTRYSVVETTNAEGKAVDSANLEYDPSFSWTVADGSNSSSAGAVFDNYSYAELLDAANAIRAYGDNAAAYLDLVELAKTGQQMEVTLGNGATAHARLVDVNANGLIFMLDPLPGTYPMNSTEGSLWGDGESFPYSRTELRSNLLSGEIYTNYLRGLKVSGTSVQPRELTLISTYAHESDTSENNTYWLASLSELIGIGWETGVMGDVYETSEQFAYFSHNGITKDNYYKSEVVTPLMGSDAILWTRSAPGNAGGSQYATFVGDNYQDTMTNLHVVAPCFCL